MFIQNINIHLLKISRRRTMIKNKLKLKDITNIRSGVFLKATPQNDDGARYLQATDFDSQGELMSASPLTARVFFDEKTEKHLLTKGEILFAAKGANNYAVVFNGAEQAVASSSFLVLTIFGNILPEYVAWFINNPETMKKIKAGSKGTAIQAINKSFLEDLEISIPSLEKQHLIVEIDSLLKKEVELQMHIHEKKKLLLTKAIN